MSLAFPVCLLVLSAVASLAQGSLPPLREGKVPQNLAELWGEYGPRREPVAAKVTREWEQDGIVCRVLRYKPGQPAPPGGKPLAKTTEVRIRNLRWEGGEYNAAQAKGAVRSEAEHRKSFNEAIRKSLEQEKLDKK
jgi:hypothetical protein